MSGKVFLNRFQKQIIKKQILRVKEQRGNLSSIDLENRNCEKIVNENVRQRTLIADIQINKNVSVSQCKFNFISTLEKL